MSIKDRQDSRSGHLFERAEASLGRKIEDTVKAAQRGKKLSQRSTDRPGKAALRTAQATGKFLAEHTPLVLIKHSPKMVRSLLEPLPWAAALAGKGGLRAGKKVRRAALAGTKVRLDGQGRLSRRAQGWRSTEHAEIKGELHRGLASLLVRIEHLKANPALIKIAKRYYLEHVGAALPMKVGKVLISLALAKSLGLVGTTLGNLVAGSHELELAHAVGLHTALQQGAAGATLVGAFEAFFTKTLHESNLLAKDRELAAIAAEQNSVRREARAIRHGIRSLYALQSFDTTKKGFVRRKTLQSIKSARQAAERSAAQIAGEAYREVRQALAAQNEDGASSWSSLAQTAKQSFDRLYADKKKGGQSLLGGVAPLATIQDLAAAKMSQAKEGDVASQASSRPSSLRKVLATLGTLTSGNWRLERTLMRSEARAEARFAKYLGRYVEALQQVDATAASDVVARGRALGSPALLPLARVELPANVAATPLGRKLAKLRLRANVASAYFADSRQALLDYRADTPASLDDANDQPVNQARLLTTSAIRDQELALEAFRAAEQQVALSPTSLAGRATARGFAARQRRYGALSRQVQLRLDALSETNLADLPPNALRQLEARRTKMQLAKDIANLKIEQAELDAAASALVQADPPGAPSDDLQANRRKYLGNAQQILAKQAALVAAREQQKRTSAFVQSGVKHFAGAPAFVRGVAHVAWWTVAVVPILNAPYWGAVKGLSLLAKRRLAAEVERLNRPSKPPRRRRS